MTPEEAKAKVATMTADQRWQALHEARQAGWSLVLLGGWRHEDGRRASRAELTAMYADKAKEPTP